MTKTEAGNIIIDFTEKAILSALREGFPEDEVEYLLHHTANIAIMRYRMEKEEDLHREKPGD